MRAKRNLNMSKIGKSSSSTAEAIMICIDTSGWMENKESPRFKEQADAIRLYCTHKFKANPYSVVGVSGMGEDCMINLITPTSDIDLIIKSLNDARIRGDLFLAGGVMESHDFLYLGEEIGIHLPKRMAVFAGGPLSYEKEVMEDLGQWMKKHKLACDAIIFGDAARINKELFDALIAAADNDGNCNLVHVPPESTTLAALFSAQILKDGGSASHESFSVAALSLSRSLNVGARCFQQESSSVAALQLCRSHSVQLETYPDSVIPAKIEAWSQSSPDLKLDNANPNWETFGQKTGWEIFDPKTCTWKMDVANPHWETFDQRTVWGTFDPRTGTWKFDIAKPLNWETFYQKTGWETCDQETTGWETCDQETTGWEIFDPETGTWIPEVANPNRETSDQKTGTWSQSSLDLKLDDANPNSQPAETLDQKIERLQRELQSLIQQKNQQVAC